MTKEERQLLLIDLSARLPYNVKCRVVWDDTSDKILTPVELFGFEMNVISEIKSYLRPMSSMTEEEQREFGNLVGLWKDQRSGRFVNCIPNLSGEFGKTLVTEIITARAVDWLNAHHFDFRGLIEKGLALEAPEGMYKTE